MLDNNRTTTFTKDSWVKTTLPTIGILISTAVYIAIHLKTIEDKLDNTAKSSWTITEHNEWSRELSDSNHIIVPSTLGVIRNIEEMQNGEGHPIRQ
jgi:hypothetical protein